MDHNNNNSNSNNNENEEESTMKPLYGMLGVSSDASQSEIRDVYLKKSRQYHPDRGGDHQWFIQLNSAYVILSDPERRRVYDMWPGSIEDPTQLDLLAKYMPTKSKFSEFYTLLAHAVVDRFFSFKAHIIAAALSIQRDAPNIHLNLSHIAAFPIVHLLVDNIIEKLIDRKLLQQQEKQQQKKQQQDNNNNNNKKQQQQQGKFEEMMLSPMKRALVIEVLATLIAAPFELYAYRAFRSKYEGNTWFDYFTLGTANDFSPLKRMFHNTALYLRCFVSSDLKYLIGLSAFRVGYTLTSYFLSSMADYCNHRALLAGVEHKLRQRNKQNDEIDEDEEDSDSDSDNNDRDSDNEDDDDEEDEEEEEKDSDQSKSAKEIVWKGASYGAKFLSYFVPASMFSVYRLFYNIESPRISYFSQSLFRSAFLDTVSVSFFDFLHTTIDNNEINI
ncbi:hypothetical protein PPL_04924 [Heterostelium album PN500]|uniref:J domain-containing protein n=1 Tax=Heterostelium pallidum (strain ATCC 26659 / Pp 5 / PN500) TaxID=670386 RepID=D3B8Y0_HETP5|nr:hypothetical protein PPL_04924 [Heterostelium album PN500]EFA82019.1 hypothetical protein PPL_04924 [Heterostelium album PN500]|eukprot:XP_020434136.1 hypothetical protein PPL_04924 [Heterostelium album PN500]